MSLAATDWNEWVAIGTLALAGMTVFVGAVGVATARFTKQLADETKDLADVTRASLAVAQAEFTAQLRPLIVDSTHAPYRGRPPVAGMQRSLVLERALLTTFSFRNLGPGVAVLEADGPTTGPALNGPRFEGDCSDAILAVGEESTVTFTLSANSSDQYVDIAYTDVAGEQRQRTILYYRAGLDPDTGYPQFSRAGFAFYIGDEATPATVNGAGWD